jgi:hypothetical protein
MILQEEADIHLFEIRPNATVLAECRLRIEESRRLLEETRQIAEGYRPTRWVS